MTSKLWLAVAGVMTILCINRQLYLQSLLTDAGRAIAQHQGWYEQRHGFQEWSVVGVLVGAGLFGCWFIWRFHSLWAKNRLLFAGLLLLLTLMVVRAISFHPVDVFLHTTILGLKMNRVLELTGIFLICVAALKAASRQSTQPR